MMRELKKKEQQTAPAPAPSVTPVYEELKLTKLHIDPDLAIKARMQTANAHLAKEQERSALQQQKLKEASDLKKQQRQCLAAIRQDSLER